MHQKNYRRIAEGYIYGLKDPNTGQYVYVNIHKYPWQHIMDVARGKKPDRVLRDILYEFLVGSEGRGMYIRSEEVVDRYETMMLRGEPDPGLSSTPEGMLSLDWDIFDDYFPTLGDGWGALEFDMPVILKPQDVQAPSRLRYWYDKLVAEGHPIRNRPRGKMRKEK